MQSYLGHAGQTSLMLEEMKKEKRCRVARKDYEGRGNSATLRKLFKLHDEAR